MLRSPARILILAVVLGLAYLAGIGYVSKPTLVDRIRADGELIVITRFGPTTYFQGASGPAGLEYDLARRFADELGVELRLIIANSRSELFQLLATRQAHFAAAGIAATEARQERFKFTEPYMTVKQQLIYRLGERRPVDLDDLAPAVLEVAANSSAVETLQALRERHPELTWNEVHDVSADDLLYRVWSRELDFTVANSNELILSQTFHPELRAAFDLTSSAQGLAWAFPRQEDDSLFEAAQAFFQRIREDGTLAHLLEKYYGHLDRFDYVGTRTFMRHITERLPRYRAIFESAAAEHGLDWRLLAAIGYQESHWNPRAVSPTGVRGLMMLTLKTASDMGVANRLDAEQSIRGGARYFAQVQRMIPSEIEEPVRTWFALAAYNVGYGHLEDARLLTQRNGKDPNSWVDVKEHLPLLSQRKWYTQTRFGYARGWEPVRYVENVRAYYELLVRITEPQVPHTALPDDPVPLRTNFRSALESVL